LYYDHGIDVNINHQTPLDPTALGIAVGCSVYPSKASRRLRSPSCGSWPAVDPFARIGGTYYCSSMMTLALELYYRYPSVVGMPGDTAKSTR
jgi:hypothetical protein